MALSLVADIGGTNTRVALAEGAQVDAGSIRRYRNAENAGIAPILQAYLAETGSRPDAVCVDMAGPVQDGVGRLTNLDWRVDADGLRDATGAATVAVLNDLQAQGMAMGHLPEGALAPLIPGTQAAGAPRLVVNMGTGLNAQPVYAARGHTLVPPAEAGHISIPVQTAEDLRLRDWISRTYADGGTVGLEDILSGRGLERVHAFACAESGGARPLPAAEVMQAYHDGAPEAVRTAQLVTRLLGRYTGDLALITLPAGGVFLVGGVIRHLAPHLGDLGFAEAFRDKGRFAAFMDRFPVFVVADDYAALTGCAVYLDELRAP